MFLLPSWTFVALREGKCGGTRHALDGLRSGLSPRRTFAVRMRCRRLQLLAVHLS
jgi:hypothetical protein